MESIPSKLIRAHDTSLSDMQRRPAVLVPVQFISLELAYVSEGGPQHLKQAGIQETGGQVQLVQAITAGGNTISRIFIIIC